MRLNIHLISHPIIQNLASKNISKQATLNIKYETLRQLGMLITYEATRNWLKSYRIKIKQINCSRETTIIDPKDSYLIIFNDLKYLSLFQEIQLLLPKVSLKLVHDIDLNNYSQNLTELPEVNIFSKIIVVTYEVEPEYVNNLLNYLVNNQQIKINRIRLTCVKCYNDALIRISKQHTDLNIYTAKIIKTKKN